MHELSTIAEFVKATKFKLITLPKNREKKHIMNATFPGGLALLVSGPGRSCLSGLMMIRRESLAALIMR